MVLPEQLVGTWHLVTWEVVTDGHSRHPFGADASGLLTYSADGVMQATIAADGREPYSGPSARRSPDAEVARAARSYFSYAATWHLDGEVVVHEVIHALDPGFVGSQQRRHADLDGDRLTLSATEPWGESTRRHRLAWRRTAPDRPDAHRAPQHN